jgi:hypothetical protein
MFVLAAVYSDTFLFNFRQEFMGPEASGWTPSGSSLKVAAIRPGSPVDKASLLPGDVLEMVDVHPLSAMPDWFLARAQFEIGRPVRLLVLRGEQHLQLQFVLSARAWRAMRNPAVGLCVYLCRLIPLAVAILIAFSRQWYTPARVAVPFSSRVSAKRGRINDLLAGLYELQNVFGVG